MDKITDEEIERALLAYINATPAMQSLLYDINMLPEVIMSRTGKAYKNNPDWQKMLIIADAWRERGWERSA